jgi:accessory gene regulator protein AgrB
VLEVVPESKVTSYVEVTVDVVVVVSGVSVDVNVVVVGVSVVVVVSGVVVVVDVVVVVVVSPNFIRTSAYAGDDQRSISITVTVRSIPLFLQFSIVPVRPP